MCLKGKRHGRARRASAINRQALIIARALRGVDLVGFVRQIAILAARSDDQREIRAGTREMVVRDDGPGDIQLLQNRNHALAETGLGREITARSRVAPQELHVALLDAQFHLQRLVAQQRRKRVMIGEVRQIQPRFPARRHPGFRVLVRLIPLRSVTELSVRAKALDIFHQSAGVIQLRAGFQKLSDTGQRILGTVLIGGFPIIDPENLSAQLLQRMRSPAILRLDGVPGALVMIRRAAFLRPINRLVQMPQPRCVDFSVLRGHPGGRDGNRAHDHQGKGKSAKKNGLGGHRNKPAQHLEPAPVLMPRKLAGRRQK